MQTVTCTRALSDHPCFYGSAKARWGRIHLPVAPKCNIQCNFCNRLYDCANESRPAVTSGILKPNDVLPHLNALFSQRSDISVVGIAGPEDPLCEPDVTLAALRRARSAFPAMLLCLSTNGLNLAGHVDALAEVGVTHVTVTVNAVDPSVGGKIYQWVRMNKRLYRGRKAAELLLSQQRDAIVELKAKGFVVKINTVLIPEINTGHVEAIAEEVAGLGADLMNCIPMIPISGTPFENLRRLTDAEVERLRHFASLIIPQMYHCARCRADAIGLLNENNEGEKDEFRNPRAAG